MWKKYIRTLFSGIFLVAAVLFIFTNWLIEAPILFKLLVSIMCVFLAYIELVFAGYREDKNTREINKYLVDFLAFILIIQLLKTIT